jgi:hypothetical protein
MNTISEEMYKEEKEADIVLERFYRNLISPQ